jgi:hypothetical protein
MIMQTWQKMHLAKHNHAESRFSKKAFLNTHFCNLIIQQDNLLKTRKNDSSKHASRMNFMQMQFWKNMILQTRIHPKKLFSVITVWYVENMRMESWINPTHNITPFTQKLINNRRIINDVSEFDEGFRQDRQRQTIPSLIPMYSPEMERNVSENNENEEQQSRRCSSIGIEIDYTLVM